MTFFQKLGRQRQYLSNLGKQFKKHHSPSPLVEALEPRALFSMVPTGIDPTILASVTASTHVSAAATADGQYVVSWLGQKVDHTAGLFYNIYKSDGSLITSGGSTTGFIAVTGTTDFEVTVNNGHVGAIAWLASDVIHTQRLDLTAGTTLGSEVQLTAAANTHITNINIALDSNGKLALLWEQSASYNVKPTAAATAQAETADSLYLAINVQGTTTWAATKTVFDASTKVATGSYATIADSDLTVGSDGKLIVAWQAGTMTFAYDEGFGNYWPRMTALDTYFQKYDAAGEPSGTAVTVGHKAATRSIQTTSINIAADDNGNFTLAQNISYDVASDGVTWVSPKSYDVLTTRTYDSKNRALSAETEIVRSDINSDISSFSCAYDSSHNLTMMWQYYNNVTASSIEYAQNYTPKGAKVGATSALNLNHNHYSDIGSLTLLASDTGFRVTYLASSYDTGTSTLAGSVMSQSLGDSVADLAVSIGANTLKPTIKSGTTATVNLPVVVTNVGNVTATGTATIVVTLVPSGGGSEVTLATLQGQVLNITAGKSKTYTVKNLNIKPSDYGATGDYQLVVKILQAPASANTNAKNDSASVNLKVAAADASMDDLGVDSVTASFTQTVLVPGDNGTITVVIRNAGTTDITKQSVTVNVSASTDGQYNTNLKLTTKTLVLSLKAGATMTLKLPVTINPALTQGNYRFVAQVVPPGTLNDDNLTNDTAATTNGMDVVWSFGNVAGRKGATTLVWLNTDGTKVSYALSGPGFAVLETNSGNLPGNSKTGDADVLNLSYIETTSASKLTITVTGGVGYSTIGHIAGYAEIGSISAAKTNLRGNVSLMTISSLTLADATASASQEMDINSQSTKAVNITLGNAGGLTLKSGMAIGTLSAVDWSASGAYLETSSISTLKILGNTKQSIAGNMKADVVLTGTSNTKLSTLGSATIAGKLSGLWNITGAIGAMTINGLLGDAAIRATSNIASITAGAAINASILAGMAAGVQDVLTTSATKLRPTTETDFTNSNVKIGSVTFKGKVGTVVTASKDFYIAAASAGTIKLGKTELGSSAAYGVATLAGLLTIKFTPFTSITLTYTDAGKDVTTTLTPTTPDLNTKLTALNTALHFDVDMIARTISAQAGNITVGYANTVV